MVTTKIVQNQQKIQNLDKHTLKELDIHKKYICLICNYIYDESLGWPESDIPPGTKWEDVPEDWTCPDCGAKKEDFKMVEL